MQCSVFMSYLRITSVKISYHSWMIQRGQDTQDFILLVFLNQSLSRF